ncbi:MAG: AMP-binding protein, partial [candidate division WOR-3 bacterium]
MQETVYQAFSAVAQRLANRPALLHKVAGRFQPITFAQLSQAVDEVAAGLAEEGVKPGMRIGIYSYNRPEWVIADLAAIKLGAVVVPIYHTLPLDTVHYIINDAEVSHLFVENPELFNPLLPFLEQLKSLKVV